MLGIRQTGRAEGQYLGAVAQRNIELPPRHGRQVAPELTPMSV